MSLNPLTCCDFYKTGHIYQYPKGTEYVYSNLTARNDDYAPGLPGLFEGQVVFFGLQGFVKWFLIDLWNKEFFWRDKQTVIERYKRRMDSCLGPGVVGIEHISELYDLGYLPIKIKALPEGSKVPVGVPLLTITNTNPKFFWLVNYLETALSAELWKPITTATTAYKYKKLLTKYAMETGASLDFVQWQGHDFSARGQSGLQDGASSGAGHLLSFYGTDTIPAIDYLEEYYGAKGLIGGSVRATEHSVMCINGEEGEYETLERLIDDNPTGILSIVSDTWNFWRVLNEYAPRLKAKILARDGKIVFRPDSGDPVKIVCGDPLAKLASPEYCGAVTLLDEVFGSTVNAAGYAELNSKVGLIYGDSITLERADKILRGLKAKGYASSNVVFGIGSYTYQMVTRDCYGMAVKATWGQVNGVGRNIKKQPITDPGKNSHSGKLAVLDEYYVVQDCSPEVERTGLLEVVFIDGVLIKKDTLELIRERVNEV